jgi:hypothetical protein
MENTENVSLLSKITLKKQATINLTVSFLILWVMPELHESNLFSLIYRMSQEERSIFWEIIVLVILWKKVCMYMCHIPNRFQDRAISLYSSKIVKKKDILCTVVSYTGIYCSSDKVGTVYH